MDGLGSHAAEEQIEQRVSRGTRRLLGGRGNPVWRENISDAVTWLLPGDRAEVLLPVSKQRSRSCIPSIFRL